MCNLSFLIFVEFIENFETASIVEKCSEDSRNTSSSMKKRLLYSTKKVILNNTLAYIFIPKEGSGVYIVYCTLFH